MTQLSLATALMDAGKSSSTSIAKPSTEEGRLAGKPAGKEFADVMDAANTSSGKNERTYSATPEDSSKELQTADEQHAEDADQSEGLRDLADAGAIAEPDPSDVSKGTADLKASAPDVDRVSVLPVGSGTSNAGAAPEDIGAELNSLHGASHLMATELGEVTPHTPAITNDQRGAELASEQPEIPAANVRPAGQEPGLLTNTDKGAAGPVSALATVNATAVQSALSKSEAMLDPESGVAPAARGDAASGAPTGAVSIAATPVVPAGTTPTLLQKHAVDVGVGEERALRRAETAELASTPAPAQTATAAANVTAAATNASVAATQIAPVQPAVQAAQDTAQRKLIADAELDVAHIELRGGSTQGTTGTAANAAPPQPGLARHIAFQIADAMRANPDRPIELALSPKELGSVRLTISAADGNVVLQVLAERPETLDLMRRNSDGLLRDLAELGFTSIDLAFGQGSSADGDASGDDGRSTGPDDNTLMTDSELDQTVDPVAAAIQLDGANGLDIRV